MRTRHEGFADFHLSFVAGDDQGTGFSYGERYGFLTQDVLTGCGCADRPGDVEMVRQGIVDRVDGRVG